MHVALGITWIIVTAMTTVSGDLRAQNQTTPKAGQVRSLSEHNGWQVLASGDVLAVRRLLRDGEGNTVTEIIFRRPPKKFVDAVAAFDLYTPHGTYLVPGVVLQTDQHKTRKYPFTFSSKQGPVCRGGF